MIATKSELKTLLNITSMEQEDLIDLLIPTIEDDIRQYCNNGFRDPNVYVSSGLISFTHSDVVGDSITLNIGANQNGLVSAQFKAGQTIQVRGSYNNDNFFDVESVSSTVMTLYVTADRPNFPELVTEDYATFPRNVTINKVIYPPTLKLIESQMLNYKLTNHDYSVASESVARYSVTFNNDFTDGYPKTILAGLKRFRRPVFV